MPTTYNSLPSPPLFSPPFSPLPSPPPLPQDSDDASPSLTSGDQCYEEELSPLKEDKPSTLPDLGNPSISPRTDKLQLRHTPDSGIAMGSGYPSSLSSSESPPPMNKLDPKFSDGQIVATLNPSIQAARKRSRSLPELSSNVVSLSFVPNQTSMTPPPLLHSTKAPMVSSQHNPIMVSHGLQRSRLYSAPQRGTIPLSHSPAAVARPVMTTQFGKHEQTQFSPMVGRSYGQASQLGPKMGMTSPGPAFPSSSFASYSPYGNTSLQPPSTYPRATATPPGSPSPFMAHSNPQTPPLYPHSSIPKATTVPAPIPSRSPLSWHPQLRPPAPGSRPTPVLIPRVPFC